MGTSYCSNDDQNNQADCTAAGNQWVVVPGVGEGPLRDGTDDTSPDVRCAPYPYPTPTMRCALSVTPRPRAPPPAYSASIKPAWPLLITMYLLAALLLSRATLLVLLCIALAVLAVVRLYLLARLLFMLAVPTRR